MYYLTDFKHFESIFPSFSIQLTSFPLILNLLTPHFYKSLDPIGSIFFSCAVPGYRKFYEVPPQASMIDLNGQGFQSADSIHELNLLTSGLFTVNTMCTKRNVLSKM